MKIVKNNCLTTIKSDFGSTKELYSYAKNKIINYAKKQNIEYLIIADTKKNTILFEKAGEKSRVNISDFKFPTDGSNITLMHGHVTRFASPLSPVDCINLCQEKYEKVIAFNNRGRFSLLQRKKDSRDEDAQKLFRGENPLNEPLPATLIPKSPLKAFFMRIFGNPLKTYEKLIKYVLEKPEMNFRYHSTMFK